MSGTYYVPIDITYPDNVSTVYTVYAEVNVTAAYSGVICSKGRNNGSQLSGYDNKFSDEFLSLAFDLANYAESGTNYDWKLKIEAAESATGDFVDVTDQLSCQWTTPLSGSVASGFSGSGAMSAQDVYTGEAKISLNDLDPDHKYVV